MNPGHHFSAHPDKVPALNLFEKQRLVMSTSMVTVWTSVILQFCSNLEMLLLSLFCAIALESFFYWLAEYLLGTCSVWQLHHWFTGNYGMTLKQNSIYSWHTAVCFFSINKLECMLLHYFFFTIEKSDETIGNTNTRWILNSESKKCPSQFHTAQVDVLRFFVLYDLVQNPKIFNFQ